MRSVVCLPPPARALLSSATTTQYRAADTVRLASGMSVVVVAEVTGRGAPDSLPVSGMQVTADYPGGRRHAEDGVRGMLMTEQEYKQRLAENFDARSLDYNTNNFHGRLAERVVALARPQPGDVVLDIATGTGLAALAAARLVGGGGRVVGVDLSPGMLAGAKRVVEAAGAKNIELVQADAEAHAFPSATFDVVLCVSSLPYFTDFPAALKTWHGYLKSGGRVAFNCWSEASYVTGSLVRAVAAWHGITMPVTGEEIGTPDRCRAVLAAAGFVKPEVVVEPTGQHFVPMDQVERAWDGWVKNPVFHPRNPDAAATLLGLRDEYLTEARSRATEQGVWDEMTAFFVVGRKA